MRLSRRRLVALLGATALPGGARAAMRPRPRLLLVDAGLPRANAVSPRGAETLPIEGDLVRLWRDGLGRRIADAPDRVAAIVGHDTALLLAGLARESRLRTSETRLDRGTVRLEFRKRP